MNNIVFLSQSDKNSGCHLIDAIDLIMEKMKICIYCCLEFFFFFFTGWHCDIKGKFSKKY